MLKAARIAFLSASDFDTKEVHDAHGFCRKIASLKLKCSEGSCFWCHFTRRQSPRLGKTGKVSDQGAPGRTLHG